MNDAELESERLIYRRFRESDVDALLAFHSDPIAQSVYNIEISRGEIWRRVALGIGHWQFRGFGPLLLEEKSTGAYVGQCSLWFPEGWGDIEIGYGIAPAFRRKGLAAEAVRCVRNYGYGDRKFKKLVSYILPTNLASRAVVESVGAIADGEFDMSGKPHLIFVHPKP